MLLVAAVSSHAADAAEEAEAIQKALQKVMVESAGEVRMPAGVIQLDETVISGNQELPKVLYILPWRQPGGLPDI
ncbi:MAG: hypothetical protein O7E57_16535, partial [Gammaproteobacteria bacterium]|nr:hypothetical protein [Gammaproteobacteria bacterium]